MPGNIGSTEVIVLIIVGMLFFGTKKSSEIARELGKSKKEFEEAKREYTEALSGAAEELSKVEEATAEPDGDKAGKVA